MRKAVTPRVLVTEDDLAAEDVVPDSLAVLKLSEAEEDRKSEGDGPYSDKSDHLTQPLGREICSE
jgi:hypothetical protein